MPRFRVDGKVIEGVDLLKKRRVPWRADVWPFSIVYIVWLFVVIPTIDFSDAAIVLGGLVALHILVLLFTAWWVDFRCFVQYSKDHRALVELIEVMPQVLFSCLLVLFPDFGPDTIQTRIKEILFKKMTITDVDDYRC
ncbi:putative manganese-transporting ATPase pdr2 [Asimina triloba]